MLHLAGFGCESETRAVSYFDAVHETTGLGKQLQDVGQGEERDISVLIWSEIRDVAEGSHGRYKIVVGKHNSLWNACRAAGVHDYGDVVRSGRGRLLSDSSVAVFSELNDVLECHHVNSLRNVVYNQRFSRQILHDDHVGDKGEAAQYAADFGESFVRTDDCSDLRLRDSMYETSVSEVSVEGDNGEGVLKAGVRGDHPVRACLGKHHNALFGI